MPDSPPRMLGLGLSMSHAQEQFSKAFVLAVAALASCSVAAPDPDVDDIDWTLSRRPHLRQSCDDIALEAAMVYLDAVVRQTRQALRAVADGAPGGGSHKSPHGAAAALAGTSAPDGAPSCTAAAAVVRDTPSSASMSEQETTESRCRNLTPQPAKRSSWITS